MANSSIETSFQNLVNVIKEKTFSATDGANLQADIADIKIDITDLGISKIGMSQIGMANGVAGLNSEGKLDFDDIDADIVSKADLEDMWDGEDLPNLPSGYTMLSYIQNTDAQWINTGVSVTENTSADLIGLTPVEASRYGTFLGEGDQSGRIWSIRYKADSGVIQFQLGEDNKAIDGPTLVNGYEYNVHAEIGKLVVNGTEYTGSEQSLGVPIATLRIFDNGSGERARAKLFRCKIYESGVLIRDFIAAKRGTDNAIGMYDVVNNTFYGNDGNGDFTAGSPVGTRTSIGDSSTFKNLIDIVQLNMLPISRVGMAGGAASLDSNGKIPASQLPNTGSDAYRYNIITKSTGGSDASITIKKYLNEELISSTDYPYQTFDHTHVIIDSLFDMIYAEDGQAKYTMTLLENSTDHNAGYSKRWGYDEIVDFSETFVMSDEDISFIAPPFYANVSYAVGDKVTRNGSFYRCKTPHTGAWDIADFDKISVDELFDEVYESLDDKADSADLATVATTGSYNDLEDAPNWTSVADTEPKTWEGITAFTGEKIWSDGTDIYYSNGSSNQYVLDKATSTWSQKTWNGLTNFSGTDLWVDPDGDVYYSYNNTQYKLDKETSTWNIQTWYGIDPGTPSYVWNDGENVYYSNNTIQYVLDKQTSTWTQKTWTGLTRFYGKYIWTDGTDIYYSNATNQYVLDKATSTWSQKTWNGLDNFDGDRVWFDGDDIYYSYASGNKHYMLDKTNNTWVSKIWSNNIDGINMWNCDGKAYYSNGGGSGTQFEIVHKDLSELVGKPGGLATLGMDGKLLPNQTNYVTAGQKANTTLGTKATAEGIDTTASANYAHAEGYKTTASNQQAHAEGNSTTASGSGSHAEGCSTTASNSYSHVEGNYSVASANYAHAEGNGTTASHEASHAEGWGTKTGNAYQHVGGKFNVGKSTTAFEVGKGTNNNSRSNALEVDWDGNMTVAGDVTDGSGNKLADISESVSNKVSKSGDTLTGDLNKVVYTDVTYTNFSILNAEGHHDVRLHSFVNVSDEVRWYMAPCSTGESPDDYQYDYQAYTFQNATAPFVLRFVDSNSGDTVYTLEIDPSDLPTATSADPLIITIPSDVGSVTVYFSTVSTTRFATMNDVTSKLDVAGGYVSGNIAPNTDGTIDFGLGDHRYHYGYFRRLCAVESICNSTVANTNRIDLPSKTGTMALTSDIPQITAQTTDPGAGSALTTGNLIVVYEA